MVGKLRITTAAVTTAVSLAEAKAHLRVSGTQDDTYITTLIEVATNDVQNFTRRTLLPTTYTIYFDQFPTYIDLHTAPVSSVTSVKYETESGEQTLASDKYNNDVQAEPGRVYPLGGSTFPTAKDMPNAVKVQFVAGYTDAASVPAAIKQAMLLIIGRYYEQRQDVIVGTIVNEMPKAVEYLLTPYRLTEVC